MESCKGLAGLSSRSDRASMEIFLVKEGLAEELVSDNNEVCTSLTEKGMTENFECINLITFLVVATVLVYIGNFDIL
jgi:hypothetical protein